MAVFTYRLQVSWGDCDPAGILYTPRVFDYGTQAVERFNREVLGFHWYELIGNGLGAPTVHTSCDYLKPMVPGLDLGVEVRIEKLGRSSLTLLLTGIGPDGAEHFRMRFVPCFTGFPDPTAIPIPDDIRARAEAYQRLTSP